MSGRIELGSIRWNFPRRPRRGTFIRYLTIRVLAMSELEERFADALHGTARIWRQAIDRRLKNLGMSQASWMTIAVASKARTPLSQSELADRLGVEGATMVAMVDRLAKAGFVARQPCQGDRRINRVVLTEEGNRLFATVKT